MSANSNKWPTPFFCGLSFLLFAGYEVYARVSQGHSLAYSFGLLSCSPIGWLFLVGTILAWRGFTAGFALTSVLNLFTFGGACLWLSVYDEHRTHVFTIALESAVLGAITLWQFFVAMKLNRVKTVN